MTLWAPQYRTIDVPAYNTPSDVDQIEVEVNAPPEPTDEDAPENVVTITERAA